MPKFSPADKLIIEVNLSRIRLSLGIMKPTFDTPESHCQSEFKNCWQLFFKAQDKDRELEYNPTAIISTLSLLRAKQLINCSEIENSCDEFDAAVLNLLEVFYKEHLKKTMEGLFYSGNKERICKGWEILGLIMQANKAMGMRVYYEITQSVIRKNKKAGGLEMIFEPIQEDVLKLMTTREGEMFQLHDEMFTSYKREKNIKIPSADYQDDDDDAVNITPRATIFSYALENDAHFAAAALSTLEKHKPRLNADKEAGLYSNLLSKKINNGAAETFHRKREKKLPLLRKILNWLFGTKDNSKKRELSRLECIIGAALRKPGFKPNELEGDHSYNIDAPMYFCKPNADEPFNFSFDYNSDSPQSSSKETNLKIKQRVT